jgi:hypothetical protein
MKFQIAGSWWIKSPIPGPYWEKKQNGVEDTG